jgi:hypothetical protein
VAPGARGGTSSTTGLGAFPLPFTGQHTTGRLSEG